MNEPLPKIQEDYVPFRNLKMFDTARDPVKPKPIRQATRSSMLLRRLVESETWLALHAVADEYVAQHSRAMPKDPMHLIGFGVACIVREVKDEIFKAILERAMECPIEALGE
jgi:hypothetical protein